MIAIDPGGSRKGCAGARFEGAVLIEVNADAGELFSRACEHVVIERPQQDGRSRAVPPKILIDMTRNGFLLAGRIAGHTGKVTEYTPSQWKCGAKGSDSIPKAIHHSRLVKALTATERAVIREAFPGFEDMIDAAVRKGALSRWSKAENAHYPRGSALPDVLDAVGLGLFDLGRIDQKGNPT